MRWILWALAFSSSCTGILAHFHGPAINNPTTIDAAVSMGTTLVALKFDGGVVVAADSRTSAGTMVSNKLAKKINVIINQEHSTCVVCRSGSAADTQFLTREAKHEFQSRYYKLAMRRPLVSEVAHYLRHKMRNTSQGKSFQAGLICAGNDDMGCHIFSISVENGAMWEEETYSVSGSGSTFLVGYLDSLNLRPDALWSESETVELALKLLKLSISRDGASGGLIRIMILKQGGIKEKTIYPERISEEAIATTLPGFEKPRH
eukprot:Nitzschia sp. Nitz4//scaffold246_size28974//25476//26261//NITZ4_008089-RA/size28974-exonerate_est2genome-gene-0.33-mRNA-1//1//CDS//3329543933//4922//frame0